MASRGWPGVLVVILVLAQAVLWPCSAWAASPEEIGQKLKVLREQVNDLKRQLDQSKTQAPALPTAVQPVAQVTTVPAAPPAAGAPVLAQQLQARGLWLDALRGERPRQVQRLVHVSSLRPHR